MEDFGNFSSTLNDLAHPHVPDISQTISSLFDWFHDHPAPDHLPLDIRGNITGPTLVGDPGDDAPHWEHQTTAFTCAVEAQRGIIEEFTGQHVSEAQLVYDATVHGWLTDGGTSPQDMSKLLDLYHVPNHTHLNSKVEDLVAELSAGHRVIVSVDSGELWGQHAPFSAFAAQAADHAIWVTGVDFSDPNHPKVIINDSGDPDGCGKAYDLKLFADAWSHGGCEYIATDGAPAHYEQVCAVYDPVKGNIPALTHYFDNILPGFFVRVDEYGAGVPSDSRDNPDNPFLHLEGSPLENLEEFKRDSLFREI